MALVIGGDDQAGTGELDGTSCRIIVHPTAGGKIRGAHNCGSCDSEVVAAIERYSVSGDTDEFNHLECSCEAHWRAELDNDLNLPVTLGFGTFRRGNPVDLVRAP